MLAVLLSPWGNASEQSPADTGDYPGAYAEEKPATATQQVAPAPGATPPPPIAKGPKRTVSVGKFTSTGAFNSKYGSWDLGGGLQAMLTKALIDSQQFVVVERANIQDVLSEQQLKAGGLTQQGTGPQFRQIIGAQFMAYGTVTEFGHRDEGGGINLGIARGIFNSGLATQSTRGTMAFDLRVVDTTSGQIVSTHTVRKEVESSGFDASIGYKGVSFGGNQFHNTPLGQASRQAINEAVRYIVRDLAIATWKGRIVEVDGKEIYINAGRNAGVRVGDNFSIERVSKQFTDPTTGEILGTRKKVLGNIRITGVEPKMASGTYTANSAMSPKRGDLVVDSR